jgi:zinc transporter ZupT
VEIKKFYIGVGARIARAAGALALASRVVFRVVKGGWAVALGIAAGLMLLVSIVGVCPAVPTLKRKRSDS